MQSLHRDIDITNRLSLPFFSLVSRTCLSCPSKRATASGRTAIRPQACQRDFGEMNRDYCLRNDPAAVGCYNIAKGSNRSAFSLHQLSRAFEGRRGCPCASPQGRTGALPMFGDFDFSHGRSPLPTFPANCILVHSHFHSHALAQD